MAKSNAVWGIDIGQCALKALRCRPNEDSGKITADAFDYIEYPKILSQPEADPVELVREAIQQFLSRNKVRGDRVAISVSGQSGLARFIKLPPVESKKIPDIVKYEAKQQIPFALDDVVWDYQQMAGGSVEEGFALETEVGLFAMKRDQVFRALRPFVDAGIEVDIIQLTPLAIYNFTVFDQMKDLPPADQYDPESPPESVVVLSLGTDTTDLVITNGYRVWQRSVPLGGSHFTKALTKELRLTFAKAEHMKRNATQAADPKSIFQAMRPVFNDLLTEVQRSIGYFTSIDRTAKIGRVVALGNAMKLPGLQKYLSQNLGYPVVEVDNYRGLSGGAVVTSPAFKENMLSFAVCYGLTLQGLSKSQLSTNLLPREIVTDRLIRDKKPWAVAMVATLLLGCSVLFLGHYRAWSSVREDRFATAIRAADAIEAESKGHVETYTAALEDYKKIDQIGQNIVGNVEGRLLWLELLQAIDKSLPHDPVDKKPAEIPERREIHVDELDVEYFPDLAVWHATVADKLREAKLGATPALNGAVNPANPANPAAPAANGAQAAPPAPQAAPATPPPATPTPAAPADPNNPGDPNAAAVEGAKGEGWVVQLTGYHYHNQHEEGAKYVRDTLLKNLQDLKVMLPAGAGGKPQMVSIKDLGVGYPVLVRTDRIRDEEIDDPAAEDEEVDEAPVDNAGPVRAPRPRKKITLRRFDFVLQFSWQPTPVSKRIENERLRAQATAPAVAVDAAQEN